MSTYVKPQQPLYKKGTDEYIFPITTASQVVDEVTNNRLNAEAIFKRDVLTLEEMAASTENLDRKCASASSLTKLNEILTNKYTVLTRSHSSSIDVSVNLNNYRFIGLARVTATNDIRLFNPSILPIDAFKACNQIAVNYPENGQDCLMRITYINDNTVRVLMDTIADGIFACAFVI